MESAKHTIPILVRVSRELNGKMRALARREHRTVADQLRHLIEQACSDRDDTPAVSDAPPTS